MEADRDRTRLLAGEMSGLAYAALAREDVEQVKRLHAGYGAQHGLSKKRAVSGASPRCSARREAPERRTA